MSTWFKNRRQEFIAATLRQFGQIRRGDLMREFDISLPQASNDIAAFLASDPPFVTYDTTAKAYVLNEPPKAADHHGRGEDDTDADLLEEIIEGVFAQGVLHTASDIAEAIRNSCLDLKPISIPDGVAARALNDVHDIRQRIAGGHRASISSIEKLSKHVRLLAAELSASRSVGSVTLSEEN